MIDRAVDSAADETREPAWKWQRLGELCRTTSGGTPSRKRSDYFKGTIPWVKSGELPDGPVSEVQEFITEEAVADSSAKVFPAGTLLIALYGATVGKVGILARAAATNQAVCAVFPSEALEARFLFWYLRHRRAQLVAQAVGGAQPNISQTILRSLEVPVPSVGEQLRIVAEIEKQLSRLDEAAANLKRVKANLKRYKAAILNAAVEGTLIGGQAAAKWSRVQIGQVAEVISGLTKNPKRQQLPRRMPYLRVANVYADELRLDDVGEIGVADNEIEKLLLKRGDMLVVEGNGSVDQIGRVALWDGSIPNCVHQNHLIKVRFGMEVLPKWALIWLLSPGGRREIEQVSSSTSGLHTLSTGKVCRLPLPLPPIPEQERIIEEVDRRLSLLHEAHAATECGLIRTERLRSSTLSAAFSPDL